MLLTVMNPTSTDPSALPPPPPPRSSFSCDRHPAEQFTGFCPSCLRERLTTLDTPSSSRRPFAAAAIKALFSSTSKPTNFAPPPPPSKQPPSFPELRRTKSFSASKNEALGQFFEPQRKSCDVRVRNTLWTLFTLDDESKVCGGGKPSFIGAAAASSSHQNSKITGSFDKPVFEETENLYSGDDDDVGGSEIRSVRESHLENSRNAVEFEVNKDKTAEEATAREGNLKIKDHIDVDNNQEKKSSGFWAAASVFSKKWQKWRRNQKTKKPTTLPPENPISRQYRETLSEIADGRRSCDTDPRFSLDDAAARCSLDEPRASWDGYFMGRSFPTMEIPGGTLQTREYYSDSSSRRRKSVDRCSSSSIRKSVVGEMDELKMVSNAKVSPTTADCYHGARELRDECSNRNSNPLVGNGERKEIKKARRWSWRIWGFKFTHRRNKEDDEEEEEEEYSSNRVNGVGRSMSVRSEGNINTLRSNSRNGGSMRNRSARYSSHVENGFGLTPMRGSQRLANKIKHKDSNSIARSVLRLY